MHAWKVGFGRREGDSRFMHAWKAGFGRREEDSRYAGEGGIWSRVEAVGLCMLRGRERG